METILIVEDDKILNRGVSFALKKEGYNVISAYSKLEFNDIIKKENIDFLLLDINLPDGNGIELCKKIRNKVKFPIVFFTANDTEDDMLEGFESGCDDYIAKPFSLQLLKHKVNAIIRRNNIIPVDDNTFEYKDIKIDYDKMSVSVRDKEMNLTATEYKLLELLSKNKGKVLTKAMLLEKLWDNNNNFVDENTLSVNIRRIRKKIEIDPRNPDFIITVFGVGYKFGE